MKIWIKLFIFLDKLKKTLLLKKGPLTISGYVFLGLTFLIYFLSLFPNNNVFSSLNETDEAGVWEARATFEYKVMEGSAEMLDTKLVHLPSTGGIGTTMFTIGGCGIMIAAAYLFFASRRKEEA